MGRVVPAKRITRARKGRKRVIKDTRERRVLKILQALFTKDPWIFGGFYSWLPSVVPGEYLQLDVFFPQLHQYSNRPIAIEVQGEQHRRRVKWWQPSRGDFTRQKENDARKREHLRRRSIPLIEIWPEDELSPKAILAKIHEALGLKVNG